MALLRMSDLYAYIHTVLREDRMIKDSLGLTDDLVQASTKIQKKRKPTGLVKDNLPIISFYANPGMRGEENFLEYVVPFDFDIYVLDDDSEIAINIADRINELIDSKFLGIPCGSSFQSEFLTMSEVETDLADTYKFFTQILFTIGIEG
ncbi:hypothetical protein [Brevibacillus laterosporus]|uniref:hypothetical protein n=1 Tax=Brevibacillus laterosporus TaxID=1465 RepID=UPI003D24F1DE